MDTHPETFLWTGVSTGVKRSGNPDLGIAYSPYPSTAAGVFTSNSFAAAPVRECQKRLNARDTFRGLVVNSGVANAATGEQGRQDAVELMRSVADYLGIDPGAMLTASTGHIGRRLPLDKITSTIPEAIDVLDTDTEMFARSILTTDTRIKRVSREIPSIDATICGIAKGAGMIHPEMATMLAFLFIDHPVQSDWLRTNLKRACEKSFNRISVDGEMSTNDTILAFAADIPERETIDSGHSVSGELADSIESVCSALAREIVSDGEGATKIIDVRVRGASTDDDAQAVAESVAESPLVKTAIHGGDPNWGRVFSAIGATQLDLDPQNIEISFDGYTVYSPQNDRREIPEQLIDEMQNPGSHNIEIDLQMGESTYTCVTCDFSTEYVEINADYHA